MSHAPAATPRLALVAAAFHEADPALRLELLADFAAQLPPLPAPYAALRDAGMYLVPGCRTPLFLFAEVQEGCVRVWADAPREAPVVRGFAAVLRTAFDGAPAEEVHAAPADLLCTLGLTGIVGMQRTHGLSAAWAQLRAAAGARAA